MKIKSDRCIRCGVSKKEIEKKKRISCRLNGKLYEGNHKFSKITK